IYVIPYVTGCFTNFKLSLINYINIKLVWS
ncbi:hypothetical protein, partial [Plasmodium yoelii yoelii]